MRIIAGMHDDTAVFTARARIMKALASPVRLKIVDELSRGERCLCELQPLFKMNKSTLSRHVAALRHVGIISERRDGVRIFLKLETPCILKVFDCTMNVIRSEAKRQAAMFPASPRLPDFNIPHPYGMLQENKK